MGLIGVKCTKCGKISRDLLVMCGGAGSAAYLTCEWCGFDRIPPAQKHMIFEDLINPPIQGHGYIEFEGDSTSG